MTNTVRVAANKVARAAVDTRIDKVRKLNKELDRLYGMVPTERKIKIFGVTLLTLGGEQCMSFNWAMDVAYAKDSVDYWTLKMNKLTNAARNSGDGYVVLDIKTAEELFA